MYKILVVEDEKEIRDILCRYLENEGYQTLTADNGMDALEKLGEDRVHLIILDIMMPGVDGLQVLQEVRKSGNLPVILLTAKADENDRLVGFDYGADDYVTKPFSPREVMKRVAVLLKRVYQGGGSVSILVEGELELHIESQALYKRGIQVPLTASEFGILQVFFQHRGQVLTRQQLIDLALGYDYEGYDRSIDTYIRRIRSKIEENSRQPRYLRTRYGVGYVFGGNDHDH